MPPQPSAAATAPDVSVAVAVARRAATGVVSIDERHRPHEAGREPLRAFWPRAEDAAHVGHGDVDDRRRHDRRDRADHHRHAARASGSCGPKRSASAARNGSGRTRARGRASPRSRRARSGAQVHRVARLDAEGRVERRMVAHRPVDAEFVGRVRIGLDLSATSRVCAPWRKALGEAVEEALVRRSVPSITGAACRRASAGRPCRRSARPELSAMFSPERQLAVDVVAGHRRERRRTARPAPRSWPSKRFAVVVGPPDRAGCRRRRTGCRDRRSRG